jgi:hypothetical protein
MSTGISRYKKSLNEPAFSNDVVRVVSAGAPYLGVGRSRLLCKSRARTVMGVRVESEACGGIAGTGHRVQML